MTTGGWRDATLLGVGLRVGAGLVLTLALSAVVAADDDGRARRRTPVVEVFEQCRDAVVNISTTRRVQMTRRRTMLDEFFQFGPAPRDYGIQSVGSGAVIHSSGYIVTNAHVIGQASDVKVIFADGRTLPADLVAMDAEHDLAVLRVEADRPLPTIRLGRSDDLMVGETVIAIGNPVGLQHTVTTGIISAVNRELMLNPRVIYRGLLQTDAPINPGNSGGPLLNVLGELIGINTAIRGDAQNIGFAIPVDKLWELLPMMLDIERRERVRFGLRVAGPRAEVVAVRPGSPAAAAGLRIGDRVRRLGQQPIANAIDYYVLLLSQRPGSRILLQVERDNKTLQVDAPLQSIPIPDGARLCAQLFGMTLREIPATIRRRYNFDQRVGLMVAGVEPGGPAAEVGVEEGDIILGFDGVPVRTVEETGLVLESIEPGRLVEVDGLRLQPTMIRWQADLEARRPPR